MIDNNVIIDGSETNIIDEQHRNKDEERVGGGKLLVQRYTPSKHLVHNAAGTAVANAVQEPGSTMSLSWSGSSSSSYSPIRAPHLRDVLVSLQRLLRPDLANNESPSHIFMCGIESEAETFMKMRPKFFFINCEVIMGIDKDVCPSLCANIFFPVILKGGGPLHHCWGGPHSCLSFT